MLGAVLKTGLEVVRDNLGFRGERLVENEFLTESIKKSVYSIADTYFPKGGEIEWSAEDTEVGRYIMNNLHNMPVKQANMMTVAMLAYQHLIPKLYGHVESFSDLSQEQREHLFETMSHSNIFPLRMLTMSLRMFFSFGYLADERVLKDMGFFKQHQYPRDLRDIEIVEDYLNSEAAVHAMRVQEKEGTAETVEKTSTLVEFTPLQNGEQRA